MEQIIIPGYTLASNSLLMPIKDFAAKNHLLPGHRVLRVSDGQALEATFIVQNTFETALKMANEVSAVYGMPIIVTAPGRACPAPLYIAVRTVFPSRHWDAVRQFARRMRPGLRDPLARWALASQARDCHRDQTQWLADMLLPTGTQMALDQAEVPQYIRLGTQWVKDINGQKTAMPPVGLPYIVFVSWLEAQTYNAVEADILGKQYPAPSEDALDTRRSHARGAPRRTSRLDSSLEDAQGARELFTLLDRKLTARQRELLHLLIEDASSKEAAMELGVNESTVRVMRHRISKAAKIL